MYLRTIKTILVFFSFSLFFIVLSDSPLSAEYIFIKTGEIIQGSIIADSVNSITVLTADRKRKKILRKNIIRILYTKLNMGKIYIQKRDGKGLEAYKVNEDQDSYTFRRVLNKPEEFTIKRSAILFIAEKNPSGLEGEAETDRLMLKWLPPYNKVKHYNVYIKSSEKKEYKLAVKESGLTATLEKLKSNTTFWIKVTAIDTDSYESLPSNELKLTTKNIKPEKPKIIFSKRSLSPDKSTTILKIRWEKGFDKDGKVTKYRIYCTRDKKRDLTDEITKRDYVLANAKEYERIELVSVDNQGDESGSVFLSYGMEKHLFFSPGILIPMSKFSKLAGIGYGGSVGFSRQDIFVSNLEAEVMAGFYFLPGKDNIDSEIIETEHAYFSPLGVYFGYRLKITENIQMVPYFSGGAAYIDMPYTKTVAGSLEKKHLKTFGPIAGAGLAFKYAISHNLYFGLIAEYSTLISNKITDYTFIRTVISTGYKL